MRVRAAAVVIGNEVLSGKVVDANTPRLIERLKEQGIELRSVQVVPDTVDAIVDAVHRARLQAPIVFTSGGIGPTHDDVTVRAVALTLGRPVVLLEPIVQLVKAAFPDREPPAKAMRLAEGPEGSELIHSDGLKYPVLACDGVYLLPGVPELFRVQLDVVLARLPKSRLVLATLFLDASEAEVAHAIDEVALAMPHVAIGSYPTFQRDAGFRVRVTIEHPQAAPVADAVARLEVGLPAGSVVRKEG